MAAAEAGWGWEHMAATAEEARQAAAGLCHHPLVAQVLEEEAACVVGGLGVPLAGRVACQERARAGASEAATLADGALERVYPTLGPCCLAAAVEPRLLVSECLS